MTKNDEKEVIKWVKKIYKKFPKISEALANGPK